MAKHTMAAYASQYGLIDEHTLHLFKIAYPLLMLEVEIRSVKDQHTYHLIQDYLRRVVGGIANDMPPTELCMVRNEHEALKLLGLDYQFYDVAHHFYNDLVISGDIVETDMGLYLNGCVPPKAKVFSLPSAQCTLTPILVDPFDARICHRAVSKFRVKDVESMAQCNGRKIAFPTVPAYVNDPDVLERRINDKNFDFAHASEESLTQQMEDQGLPSGSRGVAVISDENGPRGKILYFACYLTVQETDEGKELRLYHTGNGKPIAELPINDSDHKILHRWVDGLCQSTAHCSVYFRMLKGIQIDLQDARGNLAEGVTRTSQGHYRFTLDAETVERFYGAKCGAMAELLSFLLEGIPFALDGYGAGRLVYVDVPDELRATLESMLEKIHSNTWIEDAPDATSVEEDDADEGLVSGRGAVADGTAALDEEEYDFVDEEDYAIFDEEYDEEE